jgi:hypothetical protein
VNLKYDHVIPTAFCFPYILALLEVGATSNRKHSTRTNDGIHAVTKKCSRNHNILVNFYVQSPVPLYIDFPAVKVSKMHSFHDIGHAWLFVSFILGIRD